MAKVQEHALVLAQQENAREAALVTECSRLARDLHDIVAHRISVIAVRAESAPYQYPDPVAKDLLVKTAEDARTALDEMRGVLSVLHRTSADAVLAPQPTIADLPALFDEIRAAGTQLTVSGDLPQLSEGAGTTAYRIIQEALTNARRHAAGERVSLSFDDVDDDVVITVTNPSTHPDITPGRGLSGMRERLSLIGGQLETRVSDGVFTLVARIPRTVP